METSVVQFRIPIALIAVPTRWGNQLNGNQTTTNHGATALGALVPTRWGNQLNGNPIQPSAVAVPAGVPTRWGNQLNGNRLVKKFR